MSQKTPTGGKKRGKLCSANASGPKATGDDFSELLSESWAEQKAAFAETGRHHLTAPRELWGDSSRHNESWRVFTVKWGF